MMRYCVKRYVHVAVLSATVAFYSPSVWADSEQAVEELVVAEQAELMELSLYSSVLFALENSPDIGINSEQAHQAKFAVDNAEAALYPTIELQAGVGRGWADPMVGGEDGKSGSNATTMASLVLRQHLVDGGTKRYAIAQQEKLHEASKIKTESAVEKVIMDTVKYYLGIHRYQNALADSQVFMERIAGVIGIVEDLFDAGAASKVTLDYALSRQSSAEVEFNNVVSSLNDSVSNLEFLTGPVPEFIAVLPEDLKSDAIEHSVYVDRAMKDNSHLKTNFYEAASVDDKIESIQGEFRPAVDLSIETQTKYNDGGEAGKEQKAKMMVNFKYKLFDGGVREAKRSSAFSQKRELQFRRDKLMRNVKKDIKLAYNQISSVRNSIVSTEAEIESDIALQELNMDNFKLGNINVIELIEGEERLNTARMKRHKLLAELYHNSFKLQVLVGMMEKDDFCSSC